MNIQELLKEGKNILKQNRIENYDIQVKQVLMYVLNVEKTFLIINSLEEVKKDKEQEFFEYINKLVEGVPIQYITKNQEFMKMNFFVDENVLIPQPDTEILVEEVIKEAKDKRNLKILDMCTGSGAIAISLAKYLDDSNKIYAVDISPKALDIARKNADLNKITNINFIQSNMFENINEKFDIIVSNPPYIETDLINTLPKQVQNEPHIALDGGKDGLDFYRILINESTQYLNDNGFIFLEIGYNQKQNVFEMIVQAKRKYVEYSCIKDLAGNDRTIKIKI